MRLCLLIMPLLLSSPSLAEIGSRIEQRKVYPPSQGGRAPKKISVGSSSPIAKCGGFKPMADISAKGALFEGFEDVVRAPAASRKQGDEAPAKPGCSSPAR